MTLSSPSFSMWLLILLYYSVCACTSATKYPILGEAQKASN